MLFWILVIWLVVTTQMDFISTFTAIESNPNVHEGNPLMAWAVKRGRKVTFVVINIFTAVFVYVVWLIYKPGESHTSIWWLPLVTGGIIHFYLFFHNRKFYIKK